MECLGHLFVFSDAGLAKDLSAYVIYCNRWQLHRPLGQRTPCGAARSLPWKGCRKIVAETVLGALDHIYEVAA